MSKTFLWIFICVAVLIIGLITLRKFGLVGSPAGIRVSTEKVKKRDITELVTASGKIYPEKEVKISPDVSGEIVEMMVSQEGDSVKKGQELVKIYADIVNTQRDQAAALVNQQQALVSNISAQLPGLKATLYAAQRTYDRQKQLLDQKVISRSEFEQAESALKTAQANYDAAEQTVKGNIAGVASAQANLSIAAKNLSRTTVVSPIDGVISLLSVKKGERVVGSNMMSGTEMMRVADMSKIETIVDVGENDIPKVHLGDSALIEVDAYNNRKFKGVVTQIASSVSTTTGSTTTVSTNDVTNYKVHIRLSQDSYKDLIDPAHPKSFPFRPGMSASADIQTRTHANVLSVPINAVTTREKNSDNVVGGRGDDTKDGQKDDKNDPSQGASDNSRNAVSSDDPDIVVFVLKADGTVRKTKVKTDIQDINYIEIADGLREGDEVVTGSYATVSKTLKNAMKVTVVPKDKLFETK
ncbi:MAG: efflux RND transporter periplasmic adaptor subunit [Puia sp.]|nr:efflux RND transporter periplasmic adaptor subunit [Puia sp.]